jgi:hypothetical protein
MNQILKRCRKSATVLAAALLVATTFVHATPESDARSLDRGAIADVTPQQKYRSAIREAGGAYKESLRDCAQMSINDRQACVRDARDTYDRDMADAKQLLN